MILVNNPGSWAHIYAPLDHSEWHGCTPTDLVFPFFLFAVGNAMAFVIPRMQLKADHAAFWAKVLKRFALIFLIGLFLNWSPFIYWFKDAIHLKGWENSRINDDGEIVTTGIRIMGVLQRTAVVYLFASIIAYYTKPKATLWIGIGILLFYWLLCCILGKPGDHFSLIGFWGTQADIGLFGTNHVYHGEGVPFDPEGLSSSFAGIVQVIFGYLTGLYIKNKGKTYEMLAGLFMAGAVLIFIGFAWDMVFPINKKIWTSSFTVYTTGLAMMVIGLFIYLIEFKNKVGAWSSFFNVFGKNPLFIFFMSGFLPRVMGLIRLPINKGTGHVDPFGWFYEHICKNVFRPDLRVGSLLFALCMVTMYWSFAYIMDRNKIYVKV